MQQILIACGYGSGWAAFQESVFRSIGFFVVIIVVMVIKAWAFPRSQWVNRRAPMLKSFIMLMTGATVVILAMTCIYFLAPALFSYRWGFIRQYHVILLLALWINDALMINYWLHQSYAQTLSLDVNQQMQVDPARSHWYQPWIIAFSTNLLLFLCLLPVFGLTN